MTNREGSQCTFVRNFRFNGDLGLSDHSHFFHSIVANSYREEDEGDEEVCAQYDVRVCVCRIVCVFVYRLNE